MKAQFKLFRRGRIFYCEDRLSGEKVSLRTGDRADAETLVHARNEAARQPLLNLQLARTYLRARDPEISTRTWQTAMDEMAKTKTDATLHRHHCAMREHAFDAIRQKPILETQPTDLLHVMQAGGVATNVFLRRLHNFAVGMNWLPWPILAKKQWPQVKFKEKRAITLAEHQAIVAHELNPERLAFYQCCWHLGGAQTDVANPTADDIDWQNRTISFRRQKSRSYSTIRFGDELEAVVRSLPKAPFSPIKTHRSKEFARACWRVAVTGVSLHSYRYAWAERAKACDYPERFALQALGHQSTAVHRAYPLAFDGVLLSDTKVPVHGRDALLETRKFKHSPKQSLFPNPVRAMSCVIPTLSMSAKSSNSPDSNNGDLVTVNSRRVGQSPSFNLSTVNIRPNVSILSVLRHLNYKPWFAIAEFVDNSLQSFIENEKRLRALHGSQFKLTVKIEISRHDGGWIIIRDNAGGIALTDFPRAFKAAEVPLDRSGLSEFGMGMKSAAFWFADEWSVRTKALGETVERKVAFDVRSILAEKREELAVTESAAAPEAHFTEIILSRLATLLQPKAVARIKDHLSSIFRKFISDGRIVLRVDDDVLAYQRPAILTATFFKTPKSKPVEWCKEIDLDFGEGQRVRGFAALFETASTSRAGFALFRRDRLIEGSHDEGWRPEPIFGKPNDYIYQRLFGELHLEGFEVTHTKDGFKWKEYEDVFLALLKEELDKEPMPLLRQADGHRARQRPEDYARGASVASTRTAADMAANVPPVIAVQIKQPVETSDQNELPATTALPATREVRFNVEGKEWIITLELTTDPAISDWLSVCDNATVRAAKAMEMKVRLSLVHPFMQHFGGVTAQQIEPLLRVAAAIALSEVTARASGVKHAGVLRRNINDFLRHGLIVPETP